MIIGVPKEIKESEYRVAVVPAGVEALRDHGHKVFIQKGAGQGSGISDADYRKVGATIVASAREVFLRAEMIVKVKEPLRPEYGLLRRGQTLFTYLHLAASRSLTRALMRTGITGFAYETLEKEDGSLPLLTPMSEIAGRMSIQEGAKYLEKPMMGKGVLLSGVPGVSTCHVVIIGGGVVGANAAKIAAGLGAQVIVLDVDLDRLRYLSDIMPPNVRLVMSNAHNIRHYVKEADLLVGAVLVKGAKAPCLVAAKTVKTMEPGAVIVDVAIDQGGCIETCDHATTHSRPTYIRHGVVHYTVANMPGAVGRTSTFALSNATFPYVLQLADRGPMTAAREDAAVMRALNLYQGKVTYAAVAEAFGMEYHDAKGLI